MSKISRRDFIKSATAAGVIGAASSGFAEAESSAKDHSQKTADFYTRPALSKSYPELVDFLKYQESDPTSMVDYLIIGSGYGGSVLSARLGEKFTEDIKSGKKSVVLLERGKEWIPGQFPHGIVSGAGTFSQGGNHKPLESGLLDSPLGLYDFHIGKNVSVLVGQGLGGTSLINASVVVSPDEDLFKLHDENTGEAIWPEAIQQDIENGQMARYYERVRKTLNIQQIPTGPGNPLPLKAQNLKRDVEALDGRVRVVDLAVNFKRDGELNNVGVPQNECRRCGDCVTGCNWGAKSTLDMNYLQIAHRHGVQIFTKVRADSVIKKDEFNFVVHVGIPQNERTDSTFVPRFIRARNVILAAGALGSTQILLKSQKYSSLPLSKAIGARFSGNGDVLGMSYATDFQSDTLGKGIKTSKRQPGPTMEMADDGRYEKDSQGEWILKPLHKRFLIEHGVFPSALVGIMRIVGLTFRKETLSALRDLIRLSSKGPLNRSMLYLGNGHDKALGKIHLGENDIVDIKWSRPMEGEFANLIEDRMREHSQVNGGKFVAPTIIPNLRPSAPKQFTTVHPLGGCRMADTPNLGVVDHLGRVYTGSQLDVHGGLYVADGSVVPYSLGVNPLLTIASLAERISDHF